MYNRKQGYGVDVDGNTHVACDIYDNAMFVMALNNMMEMIPATKTKWGKIKTDVAKILRKYLWDTKDKSLFRTCI